METKLCQECPRQSDMAEKFNYNGFLYGKWCRLDCYLRYESSKCNVANNCISIECLYSKTLNGCFICKENSLNLEKPYLCGTLCLKEFNDRLSPYLLKELLKINQE